jgi:prolyl-tRNA editing enzyme YbaK/EbsC (Cys-tRNA(Pro) deacylase)
MSDSEALHPSAQRVADVLRSRGARGTIREFDVPTKTAADAAAALGCEVGAIASTLVFMIDDQPSVVIKSGAFRVDLDLLRRHAGAHAVRQASPDEVRDATGQVIGGVSPVGWIKELRTFVDDSLSEYEELWAACGTPHAVFATTFPELLSLTGGTPISLRNE